MNLGYDFPCVRDEAALRPCSDNNNSTAQGLDLTLNAGTYYYLYVATTVPSTIVVETTLP